MPKKKDQVGVITNEVVALMEDGLSFSLAFMRVAHQHNCFHGRDRTRYGYLYRVVLRRIVRRKIQVTVPQAPITEQQQLPL